MKRHKGFEFQKFSTKQQKLLYWWSKGSPYENNDILIADGSIRSGKTIACICSFLLWSQNTFEGENFIIAGKTINSLKKNVMNPLISILMSWNWDYKYNRSENYIEIGDNTYYLYDANNQSSQDKLQGLTAAGAYADEAALFPNNFIDQMIGRCSVDGSKIYMNCNPESPHHYLKTDFIDMKDEKNICFLHFTLDDNPSLSEKIKVRYRKMFTGVFYKRFILGEWCVAEGLVYPHFNVDEHVVDEYKNNGTYYISIDYGTVNPTSMGLWCLNGDSAVRIREYYFDSRKEHRQLTDEDYYAELVKLAGNLEIERVIVDPSAASFITCIQKYGKFFVMKADNSVIDGIRTVATLLANGKLKFHSSCKDVIREFGVYAWDDKSVDKDAVIKENDHAMDDVRYFCNTIMSDRYVGRTRSRRELGI